MSNCAVYLTIEPIWLIIILAVVLILFQISQKDK